MSKVTIYVTTYCGFCDAAKRWMTANGIAYESIDVTTNNALRLELAQRSGMRTVPQIFVGETSIGGYTDMRALDNDGKLRPLLDQEGIAYNA